MQLKKEPKPLYGRPQADLVGHQLPQQASCVCIHGGRQVGRRMQAGTPMSRFAYRCLRIKRESMCSIHEEVVAAVGNPFGLSVRSAWPRSQDWSQSSFGSECDSASVYESKGPSVRTHPSRERLVGPYLLNGSCRSRRKPTRPTPPPLVPVGPSQARPGGSRGTRCLHSKSVPIRPCCRSAAAVGRPGVCRPKSSQKPGGSGGPEQ